MTTTAERKAGGGGGKQYKVIGQRLPKRMGTEMVTGHALYGADIYLPGMLSGKLLRSPHAHARIVRIDTSKAERLEGVKAVITGADMPEVKPGATFPMGEVPVDISGLAGLCMAKERAIFAGQPVAAVAATDPYIAEEAIKLIDVEYEVLPPVVDLLEAMKPGSPAIHPDLKTKTSLGEIENQGPTNVAMHSVFARGDVEKGFKEADVVIERSYRAAMAHQGYIEPLATVARWEPDGRVTVWTTTQGAFTILMQLSTVLGLPLSKLKVIPTEVGGAFGGKIYIILEPTAVMLSKKAGRPVKLVMSREDVLRATGPGSPCVFRIKTGCKKDGTITAIQGWMAYDAGCIPGSPMGAGMQTSVAPYKTPNLRLDGYDVVTNKTRVHAYRAPGSPQAAFAVEQNIDLMAKALGMDPLEFRIKNCPREGDPQVTDVPWNRIGLHEIYERVKRHPHWTSKLEGKNRGRGLAAGFWFGGRMTSSVNIKVNPDGTATVLTGAVDITGTRTAMAQMAAEELGLTPDKIDVLTGDTEAAPYNDVSGGSRITYTSSNAIYRACQDLLDKMRKRAADRLKVTPEDLTFAEGVFKVKEGHASAGKALTLKKLAIGGDGVPAGSGSTSRLQSAPAFAVHLADVEVDPETGKTTILRYTCFQDVGKAVNPTRVEAQMQGGAVQGIGWALTEEYLFDDKGWLRNASLLDYRQPTSLDLPMLDCEIIEVPASDGPYGIRGVGEVPIVPPPATLANAIANAAGVRVNAMPMNIERVYWALKGKQKELAPIPVPAPAR
ncbi:MAG: xanthine dehydrogenase family protein molybdopterin-binding subunit [Chloroflexi bacterium]|nr:xanthine dehydrogenase family protein molybdopterin-binding subunit [Chloroflexota bacterium]